MELQQLSSQCSLASASAEVVRPIPLYHAGVSLHGVWWYRWTRPYHNNSFTARFHTFLRAFGRDSRNHNPPNSSALSKTKLKRINIHRLNPDFQNLISYFQFNSNFNFPFFSSPRESPPPPFPFRFPPSSGAPTPSACDPQFRWAEKIQQKNEDWYE